MSRVRPTQILEFSGFRLDIEGRRLTGPGSVEIDLKPRAFDTLAALAVRAGELVDRRTLLDAVWPGVAVEDNNLNQAVSALRRALGDDPDTPRIVATVPGRGYRFVAPVRMIAAATAETSAPTISGFGLIAAIARPSGRVWTAAAAAVAVAALAATLWLWRPEAGQALHAGPEPQAYGDAAEPADAASAPSIAVLPFRSLSSDPEQGYFADGLSEELINRLNQLQGLRVVGRTSSFAFRGREQSPRAIGEALDADTLLEGAVSRDVGQLRVTARLVDASTGYLRWSQIYDRPADDMLAVQDEIARAVAQALSVTLGAAQQDAVAGDPEAYDRFLRASGLVSAGGRENVLRAEQLLREAIAIDPKFVPARAKLLAALYWLQAYSPERGEALAAEFDAVVDEIAQISSQSWLADLYRSQQRQRAGDWIGAERFLEAAREQEPDAVSDSVASLSLNWSVGRLSETADIVLAQLRDDPLSFGASRNAQATLIGMGRYAEAAAERERSRDLAGDRSQVTFYALMGALGHDDPDVLAAVLAEYLSTDWASEGDRSLYAVRGDREAALDVLRAQIAQGARAPGAMPAILAAAWAERYGDRTLALEGIRTWVDGAPSEAAAMFVWYPAFAGTRRDQRFKDLMRELGFLDYWRDTGVWGDFCHPLNEDEFECN